MKKLLCVWALLGVSLGAVASDSVKTLESENDKVSYAFGLVLGKRMTQDMPDLNVDVFAQAIKDAFSGDKALLTDNQVSETLTAFQRNLQQKQMEEIQKLSEENKKAGEAFLAENKNKEGVVTLESGLQYKVLKEGKGPQPGPNDVVKVHYTGTLINGKVFDSSVERGEPVSFPVNGVIAGWTEALQLMPQGSKWQLFIPSDLAYGVNGNRTIGPNETLLFEVELLDVEKKN